jgi:hypothetical protein
VRLVECQKDEMGYPGVKKDEMGYPGVRDELIPHFA